MTNSVQKQQTFFKTLCNLMPLYTKSASKQRHCFETQCNMTCPRLTISPPPTLRNHAGALQAGSMHHVTEGRRRCQTLQCLSSSQIPTESKLGGQFSYFRQKQGESLFLSMSGSRVSLMILKCILNRYVRVTLSTKIFSKKKMILDSKSTFENSTTTENR